MKRKECIIVSADTFYTLIEQAYGDLGINDILDDFAVNPIDGILTSKPQTMCDVLSNYLGANVDYIISDHADDQQIYLILKED